MTSISSNNYMNQSPRIMMDARISSAASTGAISAEDQDALGAALDSIDASIASDRSSGSKGPGDIRSRIDDLIEQQVAAGTLSDEQASELQAFFAQGPGDQSGEASLESAEGTEAMGGPGAMRGRPPGPPPGPPPSGSDSSESEDETSLIEDATTKIDALMAFLEKLRTSLASGLYGDASSSAQSAGTANSGLVIDTSA